MIKKISLFAFCILLSATLFAPVLVNAQSGISQLRQNLNTVGSKTNLNTSKEPIPVIASIINIALGFLGILAVIFIIYAGFKWMTAQGNEQQITDAKATIKSAVIGLVIIMLSWTIVSFVINRIGESSNTVPGGGAPSGTGACVYVDDDNSHGASGVCKSTAECSDRITYTACQAKQGREYHLLLPDSGCTPLDFYFEDTCAQHGHP